MTGYLDGLELLNSFGDHRMKRDKEIPPEQYEKELKA